MVTIHGGGNMLSEGLIESVDKDKLHIYIAFSCHSVISVVAIIPAQAKCTVCLVFCLCLLL